jgi:TonB family protein
MKKLICFALLCGFSLFFNINSAFAQSKTDEIVDVFDIDEIPVFAEGDDALTRFVAENGQYPEIAKQNNTNGTVYVWFVVEKDGSLSDIKINKGLTAECDAEVLRILKKMPKWTAGKKDGQTVRASYSFSIRFNLDKKTPIWVMLPPRIESLKTSKITQDNTGALPTTTPIPNDSENRIYTFVEQKPEFPGGEVALKAYLEKNVKMPVMAKENGVQGKVFITFMVEKDGSLSNPKVLRGIGYGCDDEAVRIIKNMPKWSPSKQNGQPVKVKYVLPIVFK